MDQKLVKVAKFGKVHGVKGLIKLISYSDYIFDYPYVLDNLGEKYLLKKEFSKDGNFIVSFNDNISRTIAESKNGLDLFVTRDMLPQIEQDSFYYTDLVGMKIKKDTGEEVAEIIAMHDFGAGDIMEVKFYSSSKQEYLPFNKEFIVEIDLEQKYLQYKFF
jgi:16S rRNA processing protein RimM